MLIIGAHVVADGDVLKALHKLVKMRGKALQLFLSNPCSVRKANAVNWSDKLITDVRDFCEKNDIILVIHSKYLLNLSRNVDGRNMWALNSLIDDVKIAHRIGAIGCVVHMGSRGGELTVAKAEKNMVDSVGYVISKTPDCVNTKIILETSCGEGTKIGGTLVDLTRLWKKFRRNERVGICVDTAHIFAGGSDIHLENGLSKYFADFNKKIGLKHLDVIHLNDSGREFNSHVDKHAGIGKGYIFNNKLGGMGNVKALLEVADKWNIPVILETHDDYKKEINMLYKIAVGGLRGGGSGGSGGGNEKLVRHFEKLRDFHHSFGANHIHEYNAYRKIVKILKEHPNKITGVNNVKGVEGIGKRTLEKIDEILKTGSLKMLKDIDNDKRIVARMKLQSIMGIGPSKSTELVRKGIFTIDQLRLAVKRGEVKLNDRQLISLKYSADLDKRIPRLEVKQFGVKVGNIVGKSGCKTIIAGSYMYGAKDCGDIDIIIVCNKLKTKGDVMKNGREMMVGLISKLMENGIIIETLDLGASKFTGLGRVKKGGLVRHIDIRLASVDSVEMFKLYFGSGAEYSRWIRGVARGRGYKLNEWGLYNSKGKRIDGNRRDNVMKILGL